MKRMHFVTSALAALAAVVVVLNRMSSRGEDPDEQKENGHIKGHGQRHLAESRRTLSTGSRSDEGKQEAAERPSGSSSRHRRAVSDNHGRDTVSSAIEPLPRIADTLVRMAESAKRDSWPENLYRGAVIIATLIAACSFWFAQRSSDDLAAGDAAIMRLSDQITIRDFQAIRQLNANFIRVHRPELSVGSVTFGDKTVGIQIRNRSDSQARSVSVLKLRFATALQASEVQDVCPNKPESYVADGKRRLGPDIDAHDELVVSSALPVFPPASSREPGEMVGAVRFLSAAEEAWICTTFVIPGVSLPSGDAAKSQIKLSADPQWSVDNRL